jgi:crotonobetainyl-CoA:carnitine CoA-transferase CaiB-like acyl-CoA transferase
MPGPLHGVTVVDLSRILAGPYCTMMLGDMGAEIIKIEQPGSGDDTRTWGPPWAGGESAYYLAINRNKRSLTLNLKRARARELLLRLVARADVVIDNFKVGGLDQLGLGWETLRAANPRLVHCSISGYGPDGPYAERPGYDFIAQAMGGLMSVTGEPDGPPLKLGVAAADMTTGMFACIAILAALHHRDETGEGQHLDVSLLESIVAWLANIGSSYLVAGVEGRRFGNAHPNVVPYRLFEASDKWFVVACGNDRQFAALSKIVQRPELAEDSRFTTNAGRVTNRELLEPLLVSIFTSRPAQSWIDGLLAAGVPAGPVNSVSEVFEDPQVLARQMLIELDHPTIGRLRQTGFPFKFSATPAEARLAPPLLGQHTDELLNELFGLSAEEIAALRAAGSV